VANQGWLAMQPAVACCMVTKSDPNDAQLEQVKNCNRVAHTTAGLPHTHTHKQIQHPCATYFPPAGHIIFWRGVASPLAKSRALGLVQVQLQRYK